MSLPSIKLQNLSPKEQKDIPVTFGHLFAPGDLLLSDGLKAGSIPLQVDAKAMHADGSVRHAILSWVHPKLKVGETANLQLAKTAPVNKYSDFDAVKDAAAVLQSLDARVVLKLAGQEYTASLKDGDPRSLMVWLSAGPVVVEGFVTVPLKGPAGAHRLLEARFGVRYYLDSKQARVEFAVENAKAFTSAEKLDYDVKALLNGKEVYSRTGLQHFHHSRWHVYGWTGDAPAINVQFDTAYMISTRALQNFDMSNAPSEDQIKDLANSINPSNTGPMTIGPVTAYMPTTGGRSDIGPLPAWAMMWLFSMDKRAYDVMMAAADGAGSWSVHYRDESTGYPVRTDNDKNKNITLHWNLRDRGPLPVPRFFNDNPDAPAGSWTPYTEDTAHQPSLVYLPYIVTGDYYYLEELQFWAVYNPLGTDPGNHGNGQGLLRWLQLRGQAWSMRTLGHVAYITADDHPLKDYFVKQVDNNLEFYSQTYVQGNPNALGAYDGSGYGAFNEADNFAPWQDDFFTASIGYLADLGFAKAVPLAQWKGKYSVARMTSSDFPWWLASTYALNIRPNRQSPVYPTMGDIYRATYGGDTIPNDDYQPKSAFYEGKRFVDLPFCGPEQAAVLGNANGYPWAIGQMVGYAGSAMGYPANLQPALATAYNLNLPDAQKAWDVFESRASKPDYRIAPQWDILPWSVKQTSKITPAPIPPLPMLEIGKRPADGVAGEWAKVGTEGDHVKVVSGQFFRYGVPGVGYQYGQAVVDGDFVPSNGAFGGDPAVNIIKVLELFKVSPPKTAGKIKTGSNKLLAKQKGLQVTVIDPATLAVVKVLEAVNASSTGVLTLSDVSLAIGTIYALKVVDLTGKILDIIWPATATK